MDRLNRTCSHIISLNSLKPGWGTAYIWVNCTETKRSSYWWPSRHWLHPRLSEWQPRVQRVRRISSMWRHFVFNEGHHLSGNGLSPERCPTITWNNADLLFIGPTNKILWNLKQHTNIFFHVGLFFHASTSNSIEQNNDVVNTDDEYWFNEYFSISNLVLRIGGWVDHVLESYTWKLP